MACLIAGCATRPVSDAMRAGWEERRDALQSLAAWRLQGRIGFQLDKEAWSATLHWQQQGDDYAMRLVAPFGKGTWELAGSGAGVTLRTAANEVIESAEPRELLVRHLGWDLPVSGLGYWVRGVPEPDGAEPEMEFDDSGRIKSLQQDGWDVEYQSYKPEGGMELPARMTLRNDRLRVRLSINDWKLAP